MSLLKQLSEKETLHVDFHNHLHTGSQLRQKPKGFKEGIKNLFLQEGFSNLGKILDNLMKTDLNILYITNSSDSRYEDWTSPEQLKIAEKAGYEIEQGDYYIFAKKGDRVVALGKSQEVFTNQGHILFSGLKRNKRFSDKKSLEKTLEEVDGELKIADHPYIKIKCQNGVLANSKNPEQDIKKFDALERNGNFYLPFSIANWRAIKNSKKYNKPLVANPDGHHPEDIGKTYNTFYSKDLNYNSEKAFRDSINYAVIDEKFTTRFNPIPPWRIFHHVFMIGVNKIYEFVK